MEKEKIASVSRRQFIRGLSLGAGCLALGKIDIVQAALLPKAARSEKFNVVIIGTGLAGMVAGVATQNTGAHVAVLEKLDEQKAGGNSRIAGGAIAVPLENSREAREAFFKAFMDRSSGNGSPQLIKVLADRSLDTVEWLKAQGVDLTPPIPFPGSPIGVVVVRPGVFVGMPECLKTLGSKVTERGGKIFYETKAKQLIMNEHGAVIGVRAQDASGLKDYMAESVVIASGGYAGNREMLESFVDPYAGKMMVRGVKTNTGDGHIMAREAGAMWLGMRGMESLHIAAVSPKNTASGNPARALGYTLGINKEGKRYVDESLGYVANGKATLKQPGQTIALIFDEELKKQPALGMTIKNFKHLGIEILEADTLVELAVKIGAPAGTLEKTISDFNAVVKDGKAINAKPPKTAHAHKIQTPKYYAIYPLVPGITMTFGGLKINEKAQVLEADGRVIPGLFAAGECVGGLHHGDYIGGGSLINCLVMGRIAGQGATTLAGKFRP